MLLSLPKKPPVIARALGAVVCHAILVLLYSWIWWGNENPASLNRRVLVDDEGCVPYSPPLHPKDAADGERSTLTNGHAVGSEEGEGKSEIKGRVCYTYSRADRMCLWSDVKEHAEYARAKGWSVNEVVFEGTRHCAHLMGNPRLYREAVEWLWGEGESGDEREEGKEGGVKKRAGEGGEGEGRGVVMARL